MRFNYFSLSVGKKRTISVTCALSTILYESVGWSDILPGDGEACAETVCPGRKRIERLAARLVKQQPALYLGAKTA